MRPCACSCYLLVVKRVDRVNNTIGVEAEKAHLLQDIIQNLEMDNSFYQERKMQFRLHENDALHLALKVDEERPREE